MHVLKDEKTSWFKWEWFEAVTPESVFLHISSSQLWPNCFGPLVDLWCRKTWAFAIWQVVFMIFEGIKWNLCHHLLRLFQTYGTTHLLYSLKHKRRFFEKCLRVLSPYNWTPLTFILWSKIALTFFKILLLLFFVAREKQSCRFETTCVWINDDRLFFLWWSIHYRPKNKQTNNLMFSFFIWDFPLICDVQLINDVFP